MSKSRDKAKAAKRIAWFNHKRKSLRVIGTVIDKNNPPGRLIQALTVPLSCPSCGKRHVDEGEYARKLHHNHRCVDDVAGRGCGHEWDGIVTRFGAAP